MGKIKAVLGYEKISDEKEIMDVFFKHTDKGFEFIQPLNLEDITDLGEAVLISTQTYCEEDYEGLPELSAMYEIKLNESDEGYSLLTADGLRDNVTLRIVEVDDTDKIYSARLHVVNAVVSRKPIKKVPTVFLNEDGRMTVESEQYEEIRQTFIDVEVMKPFTNNITNDEAEQTYNELLQISYNDEKKEELKEEANRYWIGNQVVRGGE